VRVQTLALDLAALKNIRVSVSSTAPGAAKPQFSMRPASALFVTNCASLSRSVHGPAKAGPVRQIVDILRQSRTFCGDYRRYSPQDAIILRRVCGDYDAYSRKKDVKEGSGGGLSCILSHGQPEHLPS